MKVLDIFSGCGGFSTGFLQAGFKIKYAIDFDKRVQETYEKNHPKTKFVLADIQDLNPNNFQDIDIIMGSPPCPEFSTAKANKDPEKGMILVNEYRKWIEIIKPKFWIMENVPGLLPYLNGFYPIKKIFNCANFGVPQIRKRIFSGKYKIPEQTHSKSPQKTLFGKKLQKWVTVKESIGDLIELIGNEMISVVRNHKSSKANSPIYQINRPSRTLTKESHYFVPNLEKFDNLKDINFESANREIEVNKPSPVIEPHFRSSHKIKNLEKTESSQKSMKHKLNSTFGTQKRYKNFRLDKPSLTITDMHGDSPIIEQELNEDNWYGEKPNWDKVKGKPGWVDKEKKYRRLTIRECARLQSFPDSFIFYGSKSTCYRMVGNAVPPLMAYHLAMAIKTKI